MKIEKYYLNLAGEYRVCAELLKRGLFAIVTFGNMKGADIIANGTNRRAVFVEVKSSNSANKFITGFYQKYKTPDVEHPDFWVLYSVQVEGNSSTERFFVLSHKELSERQMECNFGDERLSYAECVERSVAGVDNVPLRLIERFEDQWDKIVAGCSDPAMGPACSKV